MSPEMRNLTITDERGDVWAYGCILYELVSGRSLMTEYEEDDEIDITLNRLQE
jgi:serine/threonine protein kinase